MDGQIKGTLNFLSKISFFLQINFLIIKFIFRPVLESINGNLFISSAKDKNITLKTLGNGNININDINLLHTVYEVFLYLKYLYKNIESKNKKKIKSLTLGEKCIISSRKMERWKT